MFFLMLLSYLKCMNIKQKHNYFTVITVYKCLIDSMPIQFQKLFFFVRDTHIDNTRSATKKSLYMTKPSLGMFKNALFNYKVLQHEMRLCIILCLITVYALISHCQE